MTTKLVTRRKVIIVPFVRSDERLSFLTVKDRKSKEWTFITGGCKARETDLEAARRELKEETRNLFDIDISVSPHNFFRFKTTFRETKEWIGDKAKNEKVITLYTVYLIDVSAYIQDNPRMCRQAFRNTKNMRGVYNENADLNFETLDSFTHKVHVWRFIRDHVLKSSQFKTMYKKLEQSGTVEQNALKGEPV